VDAFNNYLTDMDIIDNDEEEDEDTIIETYTEGNLNEGNPREGNIFVQELAQLAGSCVPDDQTVATPGVKARIGALVPGRRSAPPTFAKHQNLSATQVLAASPPVVTSGAIIARMVTPWAMTPLANRVQTLPLRPV
jgi:hypothetical protein